MQSNGMSKAKDNKLGNICMFTFEAQGLHHTVEVAEVHIHEVHRWCNRATLASKLKAPTLKTAFCYLTCLCGQFKIP